MDVHVTKLKEIKQNKMIQAFSKNNIELLFLEDTEELLQYIKPMLKDNIKVAVGGSMTLFETGIIDAIRNSEVTFFDRYEEGLSNEEIQDVFRKSFLSDIYFTSTNALSEDGCLYNVDGNGNRVAAMIYGPKEVLVIAGKNKICTNEQEAITRIKKIAAPANAIRLNKTTPCSKTGECLECNVIDRICSSYVKLGYQGNVNRIKVIILNEELGY